MLCNAKTKNPCFLRLVNNDLVDIISLSDNGSTLGILSGVFTLYRNRVDLNDHSVDGWWLKDTSKFYVAVNPKYDNEYRKQIINFSFVRNDELSMYSAVEKSLAEVKKWVLSVMDKVNNIKEFVYYRNRMSILQDYYAVCDKTNPKGMGSCCDGAVLFALEDPFFAPQCDKDYKLSFVKYAIEHEIDNYTMDKYDKLVEKINNDYDSVCELISYVMNNPEFYEQTKQELERRKKENCEILKNYGIKI